MKKVSLFALIALLFVSCQQDDGTLVPRYDDTPQNIAEQTLTHTSITLEWNDLQALFYEIEYGVSGFILGEGSIVTTTGTSITLTDLVAETTYDYRVVAVFADGRRRVIRTIRSFTTLAAPVRPEFMPNLSQLRIFRGNLSNLAISPYAVKYELNTTLYSDYSLKQRVIAIPLGTSIISNGDGIPNFPDNTVIAKTFYYNVDDRDESLGKQVIETRVMIKINGTWEFGDYVWNESQTDAVLDNNGSTVAVSWIDEEGMNQNVNYKIPNAEDCLTCHQSFRSSTLIGPKLRSMNFDVNGVNQLQRLMDIGLLDDATDISVIGQLPNWEDTSISDEERVRAYLDMNCAHCHSMGGFHTINYYDALNAAYETSFANSHILEKKDGIMARMQTSIEGYSMPYIGVTTPHAQALDLILPYLESLE